MKNIFDKLALKTGLDIKKMIRYGSIACISLFSIIFFFGKYNAMLAFPIALTSIALSFENIRINTIKKLLKLIALDCLLVLISFYATKHIYAGIFINFLTIFFIAYFLSFSFNPKIYKPFLMLFVFTSFSHDNIKLLTNKLLAVIFGCVFVVICNFILDKKNNNSLLLDYSKPLELLFKQIENIKNTTFDLNLYNKLCKVLRSINYSIYISKSSKYLTNLNGKFKLDMFLHISLLNNILYDKIYTKKNIDESFLKLIFKISDIFETKNIDIMYSTNDMNEFFNSILIETSNFSNIETREFLSVIKNITTTLNNYKKVSEKDLKKPFTPWKKTIFYKYKTLFKTNFHKNSTRLSFALRISITLTICLFLSHIFEISKVIWISITIMSVMQIYYEDTLGKQKDRIKGNLIGIALFILITLLHIKILAWITLFCALFLTYGFKEYYKLSIFTTLASLSVASIYLDIHEIAILRVALVLLGLLIVFVANKFLFPTHVEDGIQILIAKLLFYNKEFIHMIKLNKYEDLADILILNSLISEKLSLRNTILKSDKVNNLIITNNLNMIRVAYYELIK
ncbi:MAG: FUSC family protein [Sarcina sp.]